MSDSAVSVPSGTLPRAVVDLLGLLAYAELGGFFRLSADAELAPSLTDRMELAGLAATEYEHFTRLRDRLADAGEDTAAAMAPFVGAFDAWHERTRPQSWLESLVKAYVGDGIAADFYRQVAELVDPETRELVNAVLTETGRADFVIGKVRAAVDVDRAVAGRLALWARRLVGEALSEAQRVATERRELALLLAARDDESGTGEELADLGRLFARITETNAERIKALGLTV